ncbi:response regulator [Candidatus Gracilibacteria bacterium]|nr:response regulator [Candidatus Gracilibacteria bacterium]
MNKNLPTENEEKILVVDDNEMVAIVTERGLKMFGYKTDVFLSPIEALEFFKENRDKIDLVLTDLKMPGMNGEELAAKIRKICAEIPIIFMTGTPHEMESSDEIVLGKPFSIEVLQNTVREILDVVVAEKEEN